MGYVDRGGSRHTPGLSLRKVREAFRLTQDEWARRAGTSRPTLSAYEHGRKLPAADTLERLVAAAGFELDVVPSVAWQEYGLGRGRTVWVASRLWQLEPPKALATVLPRCIWSGRHRADVLTFRTAGSERRRTSSATSMVCCWPTHGMSLSGAGLGPPRRSRERETFVRAVVRRGADRTVVARPPPDARCATRCPRVVRSQSATSPAPYATSSAQPQPRTEPCAKPARTGETRCAEWPAWASAPTRSPRQPASRDAS
jgi:transcriptional regulator with XRE-family HTH domain